jgi:hypothetical protein
MADWIMGMRGTDLEVKPVDRWRKQPKSLPWLVAALTTATGKSDGAQELVEAGLKVPPQSPAFETARYHSVRLISEQGHRAQARKLIDEFFKAKPERLTPSTANLMLAVRTTDAASLEDFARFSERQVVATNDYYMDPGDKLCSEGGQCPAAMPDRESSKVINHLPMASLIQLANMQAAPANVRDKAGRVAFIRALMLNDDASLVRSAEALSKSQKLGKDVQQILAAKTLYQRRVEAVLTVLRWPFRTYTIEPQYLGIDEGLTAGDESGGWWCDEAREQTAAANSSVRRATEGYPAFLSESERSVAEKQMAQLLKTQAAPDLFGEVLLGWARHSPDDPRVPEGLRSVVRAVHFGCGGPKAAEYAKSAFELLHRKYPTSEAAQKTKYWFPPR